MRFLREQSASWILWIWLIASVVAATVSDVHAQVTTTTLILQSSGGCLEPRGGSFLDGTPIVASTCNGEDIQAYTPIAKESSTYSWQNLGSQKCLTFESGSDATGTRLIQQSCETDGVTQRMTLAGSPTTFQPWYAVKCVEPNVLGEMVLAESCTGSSNQSIAYTLDLSLINPFVSIELSTGTVSWTAATEWGMENDLASFATTTTITGGSPVPLTFNDPSLLSLTFSQLQITGVGDYAVSVQPVDTAGNMGTARTVSFAVVADGAGGSPTDSFTIRLEGIINGAPVDHTLSFP